MNRTFALLAGCAPKGCAVAVLWITLTGVTPLPADAVRSTQLAGTASAAAPGVLERAAASSMCSAQPDTVAAAGVEAAPALRNDLGSMHYAISTPVEAAQRYFDQGLRLTYAFNHGEARRAFQHAQRLDPNCAMCFWGEALVLGPNINGLMPDAHRAAALAAAQRAHALAQTTGVRPPERALIDAMVRRYEDAPAASRVALDRAYAAAMRQAAARFREDAQIPVLYAEALMLLSPWNYWEPNGRPRGATREIVAVLERALGAHPNHPGAIHFYIHAMEGSGDAARAAPYADRLAALMPGAAHLLHMPAHIYYRIGRYVDAVDANREAVRLDERNAASPADRPMFLRGYYLHNLHFLLASALMAGDSQSALQAADRVLQQVGPQARGAQAVRAATYLAYARLGMPESTLAMPDPGPDEPYVRAMWHYARGVALAAQQRLQDAAAEAAALTALRMQANLAGAQQAGIPAVEVLDIAREVLHARIALARGELDIGIRALRAAVVLQDRLPYMEPPHWPHPLRPSLGAVLAIAGRLDEAERTFRDSLMRTPEDGWALYGLREVLVRRGDADQARAVDRQFSAAWAGPPEMLRLERL